MPVRGIGNMRSKERTEVWNDMIKIAFCDDDLSVLNEICVLLDRYRVERNQDIGYTAFCSPLELLAEIEKGTRFDILFLDVVMPGENLSLIHI